MKKPEFTNPFNLEHAKAGAPYGCEIGVVAHVLKWDRNALDYPLLGIVGDSDTPIVWSALGLPSHNPGFKLVMLPLGFIDGKPVFVGDEFVGHANTPCVARPDLSSNFNGCSWPAPAPVYPETLMGAIEFSVAVNEAGDGIHGQMVGIANAALRHAIDAGQVVLPGDTAARDMAVAVAVNNAAAEIAMKRSFAFVLDLPAIIAGVAK